MSLPSRAKFYLKGEEISNQFINVGWFITDDCLTREMITLDYPDEWDKLIMYGQKYSLEEVLKRVHKFMVDKPEVVQMLLDEKEQIEIKFSLKEIIKDEDVLI